MSSFNFRLSLDEHEKRFYNIGAWSYQSIIQTQPQERRSHPSVSIYARADCGISLSGDGSPSNLDLNEHWPYLPGNEGLKEPKYVHLDYIHHVLPMAKVIVIFRNPVER